MIIFIYEARGSKAPGPTDFRATCVTGNFDIYPARGYIFLGTGGAMDIAIQVYDTEHPEDAKEIISDIISAIASFRRSEDGHERQIINCSHFESKSATKRRQQNCPCLKAMRGGCFETDDLILCSCGYCSLDDDE